jgi:hypothetical protein
MLYKSNSHLSAPIRENLKSKFSSHNSSEGSKMIQYLILLE